MSPLRNEVQVKHVPKNTTLFKTRSTLNAPVLWPKDTISLKALDLRFFFFPLGTKVVVNLSEFSGPLKHLKEM